MVYEEDLFLKGGAKFVLKHPHLEADDCIALSVKHLLHRYTNSENECACQIYIITSDHDYLQLAGPNVHIYNLAYKNIAETKGSTGGSKVDLDIPSVFPKCGPKTAQKCIDSPDFFKKKISENPDQYMKQYELNRLLVDFNSIPAKHVEEFMETIQT
jgi:5'-3' exonuclease